MASVGFWPSGEGPCLGDHQVVNHAHFALEGGALGVRGCKGGPPQWQPARGVLRSVSGLPAAAAAIGTAPVRVFPPLARHLQQLTV